MNELVAEMVEKQLIKDFMSDTLAFMINLPHADIRIEDKFTPGVYLRKMYAPKGSVILSKVHKTEHPFILAKGRILVYDGVHEAVILKAPYQGVTLPGTQRMGIALDDVVWINVHATNHQPEDDSLEAISAAVARIEADIIEPFDNLKLVS